MEFQRWWVIKSKLFWPRINILRILIRGFFFKSFDELRFIKKCQNHTFKVNFRCQKSNKFFQKKSFKNINLRDHILQKNNKFVRSCFGRIYGVPICFWFYLTFMCYPDSWISRHLWLAKQVSGY